MTYKKTYSPCDECPHSYSKNNQESNMCKICEFQQSLDLINRLKAENKNCGVKIQNQREQLKACNEKIKEQQAEIERLTPENERLYGKVEELSLVLSDTVKIRYKEAKSEAYKEFAEACKACFPSLSKVFDIILKEMGCGE